MFNITLERMKTLFSAFFVYAEPIIGISRAPLAVPYMYQPDEDPLELAELIWGTFCSKFAPWQEGEKLQLNAHHEQFPKWLGQIALPDSEGVLPSESLIRRQLFLSVTEHMSSDAWMDFGEYCDRHRKRPPHAAAILKSMQLYLPR